MLPSNYLLTNRSYIYIYIYIYIYKKQDLTLDNPQGLICRKTQPNQTNHHFFYLY